MFATENDFILPIGYLDESGQMHREATMRLITAKDEIEVANEPKLKQNPAYLSVFLLARVVTRLGRLTEITNDITEQLFQSDLQYLQELYVRANQDQDMQLDFNCPHCNQANPKDLCMVFENQSLAEENQAKAHAVVAEV